LEYLKIIPKHMLFFLEKGEITKFNEELDYIGYSNSVWFIIPSKPFNTILSGIQRSNVPFQLSETEKYKELSFVFYLRTYKIKTKNVS